MLLLSAEKIEKSYGIKPLLEGASLYLSRGDKVGVVGLNGMGKSTLLKIIAGVEQYDSGSITKIPHLVIHYLPQQPDMQAGNTVLQQVFLGASEELRQMKEYEAKSILTKLGISDFQQDVSTLSGGQKKRVAIASALATPCDLLILDEPTNHLDHHMVAWLEQTLQKFRGALLMITHDRYFLDKVVDKVIEIERGTSQVFNGNYSAYAEKKKAQRDAQMKLYMNQQQEIHHQEEVITKLRSFNREKSIKRAESREKMLSKLELVDKPVVLNSKMRITLEPEVLSGNDVLTIEGLSKSFGDKALFRNLNVQIKRGEVVGLLGANGTGKTTLLKIINRQLRADSGKIQYGSKVSIGYYDQEQHVLDDSKTIFDEISDAYPKLTNTRIRNVLAAFLFTGEDVFQVIGTLSGGEKGRVSLAKLMLSNANFIILDEPTNHLDIQSREILEEAINNYEGTVFYVSHDRYFINQTATRILDLSPEGIVNYKGNYNYYLEQKEAGNISADSDNITLTSATDAAPAPSPEKAKEDWKRSREEAARQRKRANDLKKTEKEISRLEEENDQLKEEMALPENATNVAKLMELNTKLEENEAALLELYDKWEELSE